jgi:hypothetical protein
MDNTTREELDAIRRRVEAWDDFRASQHERDAGRLLSIIEEQDTMLKRWKAAVEGLTPNGSEYVDDPEACAAHIRERTRYPKQILELRARVEELETSLRNQIGDDASALMQEVCDQRDAAISQLATARRDAFDKAIQIVRGGWPDSGREYREPVIAALTTAREEQIP